MTREESNLLTHDLNIATLRNQKSRETGKSKVTQMEES